MGGLNNEQHNSSSSQFLCRVKFINYLISWYAPCRQLMTIFLSKMKLQKNFKLVKLNIEKNQDIVENMGIDSVPTIFLVFKGKIVDSIVGYPDEERLNEFFCSITSLVETDNEETSVNELLKEANDHMRKKEWQLAEDKLNKSYNFEKSKEKYGPSVKYGLSIQDINISLLHVS